MTNANTGLDVFSLCHTWESDIQYKRSASVVK